MNNLQKGQLVYVPSGVTLIKYDKNHNPAHIFEVKEPMHILLVKQIKNGEIGLHHNGEVWYVKVNDVYASRKGDS